MRSTKVSKTRSKIKRKRKTAQTLSQIKTIIKEEKEEEEAGKK